MTPRQESLQIDSGERLVAVRQAVRAKAEELRFSLVDQTRIITAASELARNTLQHGGGGTVAIEIVENGTRRGLRLTFKDQGPGIPDLELAMKDGYTTGGGLGLGLSGSKRLVNEFTILSKVGEGTEVSITKWK
ncbi:MAG TPA: anti-sigma regulatory factor [Terriglobia bacterium]|jgi:serine/threonine-protein kinase RsbT|nr:anti-sigma regulatory factor [Terriglobia bacterium]